MAVSSRLTVFAVASLVLACAVSQASALSTPQNVDELIAQIKSGDSSASEKAVNALAQIGAPAIKPLLDMLGSEDYYPYACAALGKMGASAMGPLKVVLESRNEDMRVNAAIALGANPDPSTVDILISAFSDKSARVAACAALGFRGKGSAALEPLLAVLKGNSPSVRKFAAMALGQLKDKRAVPTLVERLKDDKPGGRAISAQSLGFIGDPRAVDALLAVIGNKSETGDVRYRAVGALGEIRDPRALDSLTNVLDDKTEDADLRASAASALGSFKDPHAVNSLVCTLGDKDEQVRDSAETSLGLMGSIATGRLIVALRDGSAGVRTGAAKALALSSDRAAVGPLVNALNDKSADVRRSVAEALSVQNDKRARAALESSFEAKDLAAVAGAASHFIKRGKPSSEAVLTEALQAYGDQWMADMFFISGNAKLKEAARAWAAEHNATLREWPAGSKWGSGK